MNYASHLNKSESNTAKPKTMKAFQHKLSDPLPELHDHHIFEDEQWERTYDGEDAEEWMRRSDQQGE